MNYEGGLNVTGTDHDGAAMSDVVTDDAIEALFAAYSDGSSLRRVLQIAHVALAEAINAADDTVGAVHVTAVRNAD